LYIYIFFFTENNPYCSSGRFVGSPSFCRPLVYRSPFYIEDSAEIDLEVRPGLHPVPLSVLSALALAAVAITLIVLSVCLRRKQQSVLSLTSQKVEEVEEKAALADQRVEEVEEKAALADQRGAPVQVFILSSQGAPAPSAYIQDIKKQIAAFGNTVIDFSCELLQEEICSDPEGFIINQLHQKGTKILIIDNGLLDSGMKGGALDTLTHFALQQSLMNYAADYNKLACISLVDHRINTAVSLDNHDNPASLVNSPSNQQSVSNKSGLVVHTRYVYPQHRDYIMQWINT